AEQHHLVAYRDLCITDVDDELVHGDAARDRVRAAVDVHGTALRRLPGDAVGVAQRDESEIRVALAAIRVVVGDTGAGGYASHGGDRGPEGHGGAQPQIRRGTV